MDRTSGSTAALLAAAFLVLAHPLALPAACDAECTIGGPAIAPAQQRFTLCGPARGNYRYEWFGPSVPKSHVSRCLTIDGLPRGTYEYLLVISDARKELERCRHVVNVGGSTGGVRSCTITGPGEILQGSDAELCASTPAGLYRCEWTGPGDFRANGRCVRVRRPGTYTVTTRNALTGTSRTCTHVLALAGSHTGNPDDAVRSNCPREPQFWSSHCRNDRLGNTVRAIAANIDKRSRYFNWADDVDGLCSALNPPRPMTPAKQLTRQYAALLANVAAGERPAGDGAPDIGLDLDTPVSHGGADTIRDLIALTERMLATGQGDLNRAAQQLSAINAGRGIGPVCE